MTDNASEFRSQDFNRTLTDLEANHIYIRAGRSQSNGCVERVQQTLLEEFWKPAFARYVIPKYTGLQRDLVQELALYNSDRIHQGRRIKGMTPEQAITNRTLWISNPQRGVATSRREGTLGRQNAIRLRPGGVEATWGWYSAGCFGCS